MAIGENPPLGQSSLLDARDVCLRREDLTLFGRQWWTLHDEFGGDWTVPSRHLFVIWKMACLTEHWDRRRAGCQR